MTGRLLRALVTSVVALVLFMPARWGRAQLLSPGPLSSAHASIEGDEHCSDCHQSGKRVDPRACLRCHDDLDARLAASEGLHGRQYKGRPCETCHVEHLGGRGLTQWPGGDPAKLDHAQTGWPLQGAHGKPACSVCHDRKNARGHASYLTAPTTCVGCHKDIHDGRFGSECTDCHGVVSWKEVRLDRFDHDQARYALRGAHRQVKCAKCHGEPGKYVDLAFRACTDCHTDPHDGKLGLGCTDCHDEATWKKVSVAQMSPKHTGTSLAGGHASVACATCHDRGNARPPSKGGGCVSCHPIVHKAPFGRACVTCHVSIAWLGLPRSVGLAAHARTDYRLTGKHADVACAACHKAALPRDQRYRGVASGRCMDCHQDRHDGEFAASGQGECGPCHDTAGFRPTLFGAAAHASTRFPLTGKHAASACLGCHTRPRPRLDLRVARQACADCHANPHGDQFTAEMAQGGCSRCHAAGGWSLPKIDHRTWPLTGAHATARCESCHHATADDRRSGKGASYRGAPRDCGGCHDDVHLGQFRLSQPVLGCEVCHTTGSFKVPGFDHEARAGWRLTGAHSTTACVKCHAMTTVGGLEQAVRWRGLSTECRFCHANPHAPPARSAPTAPAPAVVAPLTPSPRGFLDAIACSACHTTAAWRERGAAPEAVKFDHARTGFPLTGQHVHAACAACHDTTRAIKRECESCHEDAHRGRLTRTCDTCHSPAGWKATRALEMHRMTRFPLTGVHVLANCTECHRRASEQQWTDAPIECFACHEQDYRRPSNFPVHVGTTTSAALPRDCSLCHRAMAWVPATLPASLIGTSASPLESAPPGHELRFPISFGVHRVAACPDCHVSTAVPRAVRCIGCHVHDPVVLAQQHRPQVATDGASCLTCHPGGVRR